jgi:transglutaminase-like putative cysteine protease
MRYLKRLRFTDLSALRLLDFAYVTTLLPLLLIVKLPMLLYMALVAILLFAGKKATTMTQIGVLLAGVIAIYLSLYGSFNVTGLSRLSLFVELLIYLLILAVTLQRLTRQINFYLIVSPILLLALSLFFFHSITMLIYVIVEIFVLLWLILAWHMQASFRESVKMATLYFMASLPLVVLLFIFFPRISFEHASYGFLGDEVRRMGHDGLMYLDNKALLVPSNRIVMEVGFEGKRVPPASQLYFRGSVLYVDKKEHWEPLPKPALKGKKRHYESVDDFIVYKVTLYPTQKHWLYLLDLPYEAPEGASIDADFVTTLEEKIAETQHYEATSALVYRYGKTLLSRVREAARAFDPSKNPQSYAYAQAIRQHYPDETKRANALFAFFREQNLTYSLRPDPLDLNRTTDSFLFEKKKGYCVHFAAAFVTFSRMAGIPARVVTGYKGDSANSVENYLIIKERDAHAWAEILIDGSWRRVEATAFATAIDEETRRLVSQGGMDYKEGRSLFGEVDLYLMYAKYQVETWILHYSHFRQMQLLDEIGKSPAFLLKFAAALLAVVLSSLFIVLYLRQPGCGERILCLMQPLLKRLYRWGCVQKEGETMHRFLQRCGKQYNHQEAFDRVDDLYERIRYGGETSKEGELELKKAIGDLLRRLKRRV